MYIADSRIDFALLLQFFSFLLFFEKKKAEFINGHLLIIDDQKFIYKKNKKDFRFSVVQLSLDNQE